MPTTADGPLAGWAACGGMALTGRPDGPPLASPGDPAGAVRRAVAAFAADTGLDPARLPGHALLGERAALAGFVPRAPWSAGGAFRILSCVDGPIGVSLARPTDLELIPALVEAEDAGDPWTAVAAWAAEERAADAVSRAQLLGIPAASIPETPGAARDEQAAHRSALPTVTGAPRRDTGRPPLVVDLSALWAGPLCAHLLGLAGARVVKVESPDRPDGARSGARGFYDLLHAGHASVCLDLASPRGRDALLRLVEQADVVLESSRPRALRRMGVFAEETVARGTVWTSITAYGRTGPWSERVGFGDDVAAAAGLVVHDPATGEPLPCGDALADPLTGVAAAAATAAALGEGHGRLIDLAMREVALSAAAAPGPEPHDVSRRPDGTWQVETEHARFPVHAPRARSPHGPARALGADNAAYLGHAE
ncbi:CoA transferase [Streptomyces sp. NPDC102441]|uniref:CoA transferase n=1 Tax=Streptomyces sp. NPDC102441 TaxID=3366176 RepID=UPI00380D969F